MGKNESETLVRVTNERMLLRAMFVHPSGRDTLHFNIGCKGIVKLTSW